MNALLHGHHLGLISWGREYEKRRDQILARKPEREHAIRLRCMQVVTQEMLDDLPREVAEMGRARGEAYHSKEVSLEEAIRAQEAQRDAECTHSAALDAWHQRWCSALKTPEGCPWNGERLVGVGE